MAGEKRRRYARWILLANPSLLQLESPLFFFFFFFFHYPLLRNYILIYIYIRTFFRHFFPFRYSILIFEFISTFADCWGKSGVPSRRKGCARLIRFALTFCILEFSRKLAVKSAYPRVLSPQRILPEENYAPTGTRLTLTLLRSLHFPPLSFQESSRSYLNSPSTTLSRLPTFCAFLPPSPAFLFLDFLLPAFLSIAGGSLS